MAANSWLVVRPMNDIELIIYKKITQVVPISIADGMVVFGFLTDSAGVVAASIPMNAHKVNMALFPIRPMEEFS